MITLRWVLGAVAAASVASASTDELQFFSRLLKRQDPGTPEYNCHDNCGQAIIQARNVEDVCTDDVFLTDYENCLQCSGPDNVDIWKYYGGSLAKAAGACDGLATEPLSGEQPDVGPAVPAGSATGGGDDEEETSSITSAEPTTTAEPTSAPSEEPTTTAEESSEAPTTTPTATATATTTTAEEEDGSESEQTPAPTTSAYPTQQPPSTTTGESVSSTGYATASATDSAITTPAPSATQGGNGTTTATTSSDIVQVTSGANAVLLSPVGVYGALALGAWFAVAH